MRLGSRQEAVYRLLCKRGLWYPGCGWYWGGQAETQRVLEGLVRRGMVLKTHEHLFDGDELVETYRPERLLSNEQRWAIATMKLRRGK